MADDSGLGGPTMQYQVLLDPAKVASVGLSVPLIVNSLSANNSNAGGGFYSQGGQFYYVRGLGRLQTPEDIGNVVVAVHNGTPVLVKDVGSVVIGSAPRLGQFGFNERDEAVEGRDPAAQRRAGPGRPRPAGEEDRRSSIAPSCRRT